MLAVPDRNEDIPNEIVLVDKDIETDVALGMLLRALTGESLTYWQSLVDIDAALRLADKYDVKVAYQLILNHFMSTAFLQHGLLGLFCHAARFGQRGLAAKAVLELPRKTDLSHFPAGLVRGVPGEYLWALRRCQTCSSAVSRHCGKDYPCDTHPSSFLKFLGQAESRK